LGTVCVVALRDLDNNLFLRLKVILSLDSPIADSLIQVAASKAVTVLVRQYVPLFFFGAFGFYSCIVSPRPRLPWYPTLDVLSRRR